MIRIFLALSPMALNILYICDYSLHLPKVYKNMKIVTRVLMITVIITMYMFKYFDNNEND